MAPEPIKVPAERPRLGGVGDQLRKIEVHIDTAIGHTDRRLVEFHHHIEMDLVAIPRIAQFIPALPRPAITPNAASRGSSQCRD